MALGEIFAAAQKQVRSLQGPGLFGYKGKFYDATKKTLELSAGGAYDAENGGNAAFADETQVTCNPGEPPGIREGDACILLGQAFVVKKVLLAETQGGVPIAQPIIVYRAPDATDTPADNAQTAQWPAPPE